MFVFAISEVVFVRGFWGEVLVVGVCFFFFGVLFEGIFGL